MSRRGFFIINQVPERSPPVFLKACRGIETLPGSLSAQTFNPTDCPQTPIQDKA